MSNEEKHAGTGHYCGECMHRETIGARTSECSPEWKAGKPGHWRHASPGAKACHHFISSVAVQQVDQQRYANKLKCIELMMATARELGDREKAAVAAQEDTFLILEALRGLRMVGDAREDSEETS